MLIETCDNAPLLETDADGLEVAQSAAEMPHLAGDVVGDVQVGGAQIDVVGDQRCARADRDARRRVHATAEIGFPLRLPHLFPHALELAFADLARFLRCGAEADSSYRKIGEL